MNVVAIITKDKCVWCDKVKKMLREYPNVLIYEYNLNIEPIMLDFMVSAGFKTVPIVFHNGYLVGGYEESVRYFGGLLDDGFN